MVLGEVYAITIELFPIANLFCRGHRLRLDISSSNFPHFDVNPNSGEPEGEWQQPRITRNRVFAEAARSSHPVADHSVGWVKIQMYGPLRFLTRNVRMFESSSDVVPVEPPVSLRRPWGHPFPDLAENFPAMPI